jgi:ribosome-binding protein aMBF1 (putative translation factor)
VASTKDLLDSLEQYEKEPESRGYELRLEFSRLVLRHLRAKGWTQKELADRAGVKASFINRLIHSDANWTSDSAGRILHALGVHVVFNEWPDGEAKQSREIHGEAEIETVGCIIGTATGGKSRYLTVEDFKH